MNGLRFYLRLFLLVVLLTCGCSGQVVTPMPSTTLALLSTANIAPKSPSNTPRPSSSPTLTPVLPTSPAPIEKTKTGQPNLLTLTITPSSTPDFRIWNETADFYKTIAIADRDDEKFVIFQPGGSSQKIFSFDPGPYNPIQASQITTRCALIAVVYTDEGHKIIRLDKNGKSIEEIFSFQQRIPGTAKYLPFLSPDGTMVSYVVFSGEQYRSSAEYQDVEIVKLNQPDLPIRLTAHGRAWDEGGVWSPDGSQIAYTDRDDQGALQVYATKIDDMTQRPLTHFENQERKPGPISWAPSGDRLAVIFYDQEDEGEVWIIPFPLGKAYRLILPEGVVTLGYTLAWSEDGTKLLLDVGDYTDSQLEGLYWFDVEDNRLLHVITIDAASKLNPNVHQFAFPFPLTTDLSLVGFYSFMDWYSYDARDGKIETLTQLDQQQWGVHMSVSAFTKNIFTCGQ